MKAKTYNARAAAMHVVADERDFLPNAQDLLTEGVKDEHPRVRLEAVRGLSFFQNPAAADAALVALNYEMDSWLNYTLEHTLVALDKQWMPAYQDGKLADGNDRVKQFVEAFVARRAPGMAAQSEIKRLIKPETPEDARKKAYAKLETMHGDENNGRSVFTRTCVSCHKVGNTGYTFGPDLSDVGKRLNRHDLIESIIEPSKKVDPKYVTTTIITNEGKAMVGFIVKKSQDSVTLLMAEGKQATIPLSDIDEQGETNQSSMPENLASTLSPGEFLDVIEFLSNRK
jgi:putative heme-binding domain-containing protein